MWKGSIGNMERLMKLELRKIHFGNYILLTTAMIFLSMFFVFVSLNDISDHVRTFEDTFRTVEMIFAFVFIILFSVLNSALVLSEYNNRTILLMFTYPVDRKKVIAAKLLIITIFITVSMIVGYALCGMFIVGTDRWFDLLEGEFTAEVLAGWATRAAVTVIVFICLGLWTFAAGMVKKSVSASIVSSVVFIFLRQVVVASSKSQQESAWVVCVTVGITAAIMGYIFAKKVVEVE